MTAEPATRLSINQRALLSEWLGEYEVIADRSWPLQTTAVLEIDAMLGRVIVKASTGDLQAHHISREITAHRTMLAGVRQWTPELLFADEPELLLVTRFLPGHLVQGSEWEHDAGIFTAAGRLMTALHTGFPSRRSEIAIPALLKKAHQWLARADPAALSPARRRQVLSVLESVEPHPVQIVCTHGDFQPRNWLVDPDRADGAGTPLVLLIDFGRADHRPWYSDVVRLHHQVFGDRPDLRRAFYEGAGRPPDDPIADHELAGWHLENLVQSLGTIVWAAEVGDHAFEGQGHDMLERTLSETHGP